MKNLANKLIFFAFVLNFLQIQSQDIAVQSFESSGDTWTPLNFSTPPCTSNNDIWNYVTNIPGINPSSGNRFWGIRDLNGSCGGNGFETITFPNVSVAGSNNVVFSFDYNAINFDNNEDLKYELFYDNVSQGEVIVVNGVNGRSDNTNGWRSEEVNIPNSVNNVSVKLFAKCNANNERAGFDNVKLATVTATVDDCNGAVPLTVFSQGGSNGNETAATTANATASSMSNTSCDSFTSNQNLDLFYTFTVPAGETSINVITGGATGGNINVAVWDNCNGNELYCSNVNSTDHQITGLTPNTTYILQVWHDSFNAGSFTIALETPGAPPSNNDCSNATSLTVGTNNTQNVVTGTNVNATDSGALPTPNCASYRGNDIWYEAQIPSSGILIVETLNAGSNIDTAIGVYTGTCNNLTAIACDDDSGPGYYSKLTLTGLPNTTVKIRVWTWRNNSQGNFNIVAYSPECLGSTTWRNGGWSNGVPNSGTSAIISRNYDTAVHGNFEACNLQINNNRTVNISANGYITINNDLNVIGTLEVRHEGSLVMISDTGNVTVAGDINVYKTSNEVKLYDFNYWSSPVIGETIGNVLSASHQKDIYYYEPTVFNNSLNSGWIATNESTVFEPGKGYIALGPAAGPFPQTHSVVFNGVVNNGVVNVPLALSSLTSATNDDFNLIGNPYPSAINADSLLLDPTNSAAGNTIYLWTHNTAANLASSGSHYSSGDYATYTVGMGGVQASSGGPEPTGKIASGQGFFIEANTVGTITFNNSIRVASGNNQFFKGPDTKSTVSESKKDLIWLNLTSKEGAFNQLLIGFVKDASNSIDDFDGPQLGGGYVSFYSVIDDQHLAINGMAPLEENTVIPLGFKSYLEIGKKLKIEIKDIEGNLNNEDQEILLIDKLKNTVHDLRIEAYEFETATKGTVNNRFELSMNGKSTLSVENEHMNKKLIVRNTDQELQVFMANNEPIANLKIYDIQGRLLYTTKEPLTKHHVDTKAISNGSVLIIQAGLENNIKINKKTILYK